MQSEAACVALLFSTMVVPFIIAAAALRGYIPLSALWRDRYSRSGELVPVPVERR